MAPAKQKPKAKKDDMRVFKFVLVNVEDDLDWAISEENVLLRVLIEVATYSEEYEIRIKIGNAIRKHYALIGVNDFSFLGAIRRKLTVPVSCDAFNLKHLKLHDCWPESPLPKINAWPGMFE